MKTSFSPLAYGSSDTHPKLLPLKQVGSAQNLNSTEILADDEPHRSNTYTFVEKSPNNLSYLDRIVNDQSAGQLSQHKQIQMH